MVVLQAPKIQFSEKSGASASVSGSLVTFNVNGTTVAQATANASTVLNFSQSETKAGYIKIHATVVELYIDVGDTCGGSVTPALKKEINALVDGLCTNQVVPYINKIFPGIPIPTVSGFDLKNMTIKVMDAYLAVGVDIGASPAARIAPPAPPVLLVAAASQPQQPPLQRKLLNSRLLPVNVNVGNLTHGDFNLNVSHSAINKALALYLPSVIGQLGDVSVPAMSGKNSGVEWSTDATTVENIHIGNASISVVPNVGLTVTLSNIGLSIPSTSFKVSKHIIIKLGCSGHFSGTLASTSVFVALKVTRDATGAPIMTPTSKWNWGSLDVRFKLNSIACKVVQDIAKLFIGSINGKIRAAIEQSVPSVLDRVIATQGNQALLQLTQPINVDEYASIDLRLATNPMFTSNQIDLSLLGVWGPPLELPLEPSLLNEEVK